MPLTIHARRVDFKGEMLTAREISARTGLHINTISWRLKHGKPIDAPREKKNGKQAKRILYRGQLMTVQEIATATGQGLSTVYNHQDGERYYEPHERGNLDSDTPSLPSHAFFLTHDGITDCVAGWARRVGIGRDTLGKRISTPGWTLKQALETPTRARHARELTYNEITDTIAGWARRAGLDYSTLYARLDLHKLPLDVALKTPVNTLEERRSIAQTVAKMAALFNSTRDGMASPSQMDATP